VAKWRNIPAQFNWDGESLTPASTRARPQRVRPSKVAPAVLAPEQPQASETPSENLNLSRLDGLSDEEKVAALKTEAALNAVLALIPEPVTEEPVAEPKPKPKPEPKPAETAESEECPVTGQNELWESPVQDLPMGNSAIYPDGRPIANPNHLMLFLQRGAEVLRTYAQTGWVSYLQRGDGKKNPLQESLVETMVKSGVLREVKTGVFRGD
jgi:hypothetical protein